MPFVTPYASEHQLTITPKMLMQFLLGSKKRCEKVLILTSNYHVHTFLVLPLTPLKN